MSTLPWIPLHVKDEKPQHEVNSSAFYISKYPVTNSQYAQFIQATGYQPPDHWFGKISPIELSNHPVTWVSWHDAQAYCSWLAQATQTKVRLPTEAEWEKAARGADARLYPWGNQFDPYLCNNEKNDIWSTSTVGIFPNGNSVYGLSDVAGNVFEWTCSLFKGYPFQDDFNNSTDSNGVRVLRGGAFNYGQECVRCAGRLASNPGLSGSYIGFRIVVLID